MKKHWNFALSIGCLLCGFSNPSYAQLEIGLGTGINALQGDLGGSSANGAYRFWDLDIASLRPNVNVFVRYNLNAQWSFKGNYTYAALAGSDKYAGNPEIYERGVSMSGNLSELAVMMEFHPAKHGRVYFMGGLAVVSSNANVSQFGAPLKPEFNQKYFAIPMGIGATVSNPNHRGKLQIEAVFHYVHSDLVDGFTSPESRSNDTYSFLQVQYAYPIGNDPKYYHNPKKIKRQHNQICASF